MTPIAFIWIVLTFLPGVEQCGARTRLWLGVANDLEGAETLRSGSLTKTAENLRSGPNHGESATYRAQKTK